MFRLRHHVPHHADASCAGRCAFGAALDVRGKDVLDLGLDLSQFVERDRDPGVGESGFLPPLRLEVGLVALEPFLRKAVVAQEHVLPKQSGSGLARGVVGGG